MGGRGSRTTGRSNKKSRVITAKEWANMPGRVKVKIALKKKVKAGTATKNDIKSLRNLEDMHAQRAGYKNKKDFDAHAKSREATLKRKQEQEIHAKERWRQTTTTTYQRARRGIESKFNEFYFRSRK